MGPLEQVITDWRERASDTRRLGRDDQALATSGLLHGKRGTA